MTTLTEDRMPQESTVPALLVVAGHARASAAEQAFVWAGILLVCLLVWNTIAYGAIGLLGIG